MRDVNEVLQSCVHFMALYPYMLSKENGCDMGQPDVNDKHYQFLFEEAKAGLEDISDSFGDQMTIESFARYYGKTWYRAFREGIHKNVPISLASDAHTSMRGLFVHSTSVCHMNKEDFMVEQLLDPELYNITEAARYSKEEIDTFKELGTRIEGIYQSMISHFNERYPTVALYNYRDVKSESFAFLDPKLAKQFCAYVDFKTEVDKTVCPAYYDNTADAPYTHFRKMYDNFDQLMDGMTHTSDPYMVLAEYRGAAAGQCSYFEKTYKEMSESLKDSHKKLIVSAYGLDIRDIAKSCGPTELKEFFVADPEVYFGDSLKDDPVRAMSGVLKRSIAKQYDDLARDIADLDEVESKFPNKTDIGSKPKMLFQMLREGKTLGFTGAAVNRAKDLYVQSENLLDRKDFFDYADNSDHSRVLAIYGNYGELIHHQEEWVDSLQENYNGDLGDQ